MKLRPARLSTELEYPRYNNYQRDRRRTLELLAIAGAAAATGTLVGCDLFNRPHGVTRGDVAAPVPPSDDDDSASQTTDPVRPEIAVDGGLAEPDPIEPPTPTPAPTGTGADLKSLDALPKDANVAGGLRASSERVPDPPPPAKTGDDKE